LQHVLGVLRIGGVPALRLLDVVAADDDLLDLVELVDAVQARRVLAGGARLDAGSTGSSPRIFRK
jgi:hypothetical protein